MTTAVVVALIAATPPTLAAWFTFLQARAAARRAMAQDAAGVTRALGEMKVGLGRVEATVERIDQGVVELRERVARLEGAHALPAPERVSSPSARALVGHPPPGSER